tara:strand:+ start:10498 stop:11382 length:885 start_codon:yes stop_codon:yes gene_type:complete
MLPDNFDFAMLPDIAHTGSMTLEEIGMLASTLEDIDYSLTSWVKKDLALTARTNEGRVTVPVLWQTPERAFQIKNSKELRDQQGALKLPLISVERTGVVKDPANKGSYQAQIYSNDGDGRSGRMVIARRIVQDKTRNFAAATAMRQLPKQTSFQKYYPRINKKIVIQTLSIPIPIYVDVNYKILINTEYQQQMNDLVAPFIARTGQINSFVMRRNGHLYEAFIDQDFTHSNNVATLNEDIRTFSTEIKIRVLGYLIGEGNNDDRRIVKVEENAVEITFPRETVPLPGDPGFIED